MNVFLDANVILDYLTDRQPFADDAEAVGGWRENHNIDFAICIIVGEYDIIWASA